MARHYLLGGGDCFSLPDNLPVSAFLLTLSSVTLLEVEVVKVCGGVVVGKKIPYMVSGFSFFIRNLFWCYFIRCFYKMPVNVKKKNAPL